MVTGHCPTACSFVWAGGQTVEIANANVSGAAAPSVQSSTASNGWANTKIPIRLFLR